MIIHILDIKLISSKPGKCEELLISVNAKLKITSWHPAKELGKNTTSDQMGGTEETQGKGVPQTGEPTAPPMASNYETNLNQPLGRPWSTGLFDCHENQTNAVMTAFLPCVTFGQIAEVLDGGEMACHLGSFIYLLMMPALCSQWIMGSKYRTKLRAKYGLVEAPYTDVISHVFCPCCSLCQEFRELKSRGLDPALGWNGILAQQQVNQYQGETLGVPAAQTMYK